MRKLLIGLTLIGTIALLGMGCKNTDKAPEPTQNATIDIESASPTGEAPVDVPNIE